MYQRDESPYEKKLKEEQFKRFKNVMDQFVSPQPEADRPKQIPAVIGCDSGWINCIDALPDFRENIKYDVWHKQKGRLIDCHFFMPNHNPEDAYFRTQISNVVLSLDFITHWRRSPLPPNHGR